MALLASCWLLVESFIIPGGFLKWFYLSFYINPLLLVFCQIFLLLKKLKKCLLFFIFPFTIAFRLCLFIFRFLMKVVFCLFSFTKTTTVEVYYDAFGTDISSVDCEYVVVSYSSRWNSIHASCDESKDVENEWTACRNLDHAYEATEENDQTTSCVNDSWLNKYLYSDHYSTSVYDFDVSETSLPDRENSTTSFRFSFMDQTFDFKSHESINQEFILETEDSENSTSHSCDPQLLENLLLTSQEGVRPVSSFEFYDSLSTSDECLLVDHESCGSNSPSSKQKLKIRNIQQDDDPFHQKYTSRMRFFNVLYHERLHGMNAILNEHSMMPSFFNWAEPPTDLPRQFMLWSTVARKRILRSLESDIELIYVAQSCLFWEALHHQYHKVEALTFSDHSENMVFQHTVSIKFQELQILLERFVEDQKCECQGSSSSTQKRLSFQGLLQVPDATGFVFVEGENKSIKGQYCIRPAEVLEAINKSIEAFWMYIKTDNKKLSWKYESFWRTHPPVEDPQDLELLYSVTKTLHKGMMLRDVQGKSKCWLRRKVKPLQTVDEKRNLVFAMIDMKLVQRLLKMSVVSTAHLNWCREKLNNLDFKQGRVYRGRISHLFPSS